MAQLPSITSPKLVARFFAGSIMILTLTLVVPAQAATTNPASPMVSFTFDDGRASTFAKSAPTLAKYNLSGTAYITTGCVGMTKVPNTCHAANDVSYMTWAQIKTLKNTYNWEIGSHSETHPYMASTNPDDGQPAQLTDAQIIRELKNSKATLAAQGIDATAYASPYGDYDAFVLQEVAKLYSSHRGFADQRDNTWPYNDLLINNMQVQSPVTVASVKAKIDYAIANKLWLVLTFHDIVDRPSTNTNKYQWGTARLDAIASYVNAKRIAGALKAVNASGGLATGTTNLLPGSDFTAGIANGWRTDRPTIFAADSATNGSTPEVKNSVKIVANTQATSAHLFSPLVTVDASTIYLLKLYLNVKAISSGEVGFYIDEYDAAGNWVSGQYKARETGVFVQNINMSYTPTSPQVKQASLQIYSTANSRAVGYLDSVRWFAISSITPSNSGLVPDSGLSNPWASGWSTDSSTTITSTGNGITINQTNGTTHLFSPKIGVDATRTYYFESTLDTTLSNGSEVGIYIDEYDIAGNWISGQYKLSDTRQGVHSLSATYRPSSAAINKIRLQYIFISGAGLQTTLDDSQLWVL